MSTGGLVYHRIDRRALADFVARQVDLIETTPAPDELVALGFTAELDGMTADELRAVWLGAGLAALVGLALVEQPERFITAAPPVTLVAG
jgi:hypothetical protein